MESSGEIEIEKFQQIAASVEDQIADTYERLIKLKKYQEYLQSVEVTESIIIQEVADHAQVLLSIDPTLVDVFLKKICHVLPRS